MAFHSIFVINFENMQRVFFILLLLDDTNHIDEMFFNSNDFIHNFFFGLIISIIVHHGYNKLSCHLGLTSFQVVFGSKSCFFPYSLPWNTASLYTQASPCLSVSAQLSCGQILPGICVFPDARW